jgi:hypothetical protein
MVYRTVVGTDGSFFRCNVLTRGQAASQGSNAACGLVLRIRNKSTRPIAAPGCKQKMGRLAVRLAVGSFPESQDFAQIRAGGLEHARWYAETTSFAHSGQAPLVRRTSRGAIRTAVQHLFVGQFCKLRNFANGTRAGPHRLRRRGDERGERDSFLFALEWFCGPGRTDGGRIDMSTRMLVVFARLR